jgi:hypothetical protein
MAVTVRFVDGSEKSYPTATSATRRGSLIVVAKDNPRKRNLEAVAVFPRDQVDFATVSDRGVTTSIVSGRP